MKVMYKLTFVPPKSSRPGSAILSMLYFLIFFWLPLDIFLYLKIREFDLYWFIILFGIMAMIALGMGAAKYIEWLKRGWGTVDILEVYDDGWIRCRSRGEWDPDVPLDKIVRVDTWKVKIKDNEYSLIIRILFNHKGKICLTGCGGHIKIDDLPYLFEVLTYLQKIAAENRKRMGEEGYPRWWDGDLSWLEEDEWKKVKEERDRLRKEHGIPVDYARDVVYRW